MINKDMMVLQNYTDLGNAVPGPCGGTYTASHDATQAMNIKSEEVSDEDEKEDAVQMSFPKITVESEVSCMFLYLHCWQISQICRSANYIFYLHLSVCAHESTLFFPLPHSSQSKYPDNVLGFQTYFSSEENSLYYFLSFCRVLQMNWYMYVVRSGHTPTMFAIKHSV
jgi:hypothetical protein